MQNRSLVVETMALFARSETDQVDPVDDLMDEINGSVDGDKYDTPFVFDMCDVVAVHKSGILGYSTIWINGSGQTVKIPFPEVVELFLKSRENVVNLKD